MSRAKPTATNCRQIVATAFAAFALLVSAFTAPAFSQTTIEADAAYDTLLKRYVSASADGINRVDYVRWQSTPADREALDAFLAHQSTRRPSTMPRAEAFAYWVNLYNAIHIKIILAHYPVASFSETPSVDGPWKDKRITVEGRTLSLDEMKNNIMRPALADARLHYAVNCASFGCPRLMARAWRSDTIDADLDAAARAFINHPRAVTVLPSGDLQVSSIYIWFSDDFGGNASAIVSHIRQYAEPALAARLTPSVKLVDGGYDWSINALLPPGKSGG